MSVVDPSDRRTLQPLDSKQPSSAEALTVRFWGVRGEVPTPGNDMVGYGGNTACVELRVGQERLIFDGGTGLRVLGKQILQEMPVRAHLFFTHTHWDRIQGFPFFQPAYLEGNGFEIYGAVAQNGASIKQRLSDQMLRPNFSIPLQMMRSELRFHDISPGQVISIDKEIQVESLFINRSTGGLGYRVTWRGRTVVYATDIEPDCEHIEQSLQYLAQEADLLIFDVAGSDCTTLPQQTPENRFADRLDEQQIKLWTAGIQVAIAVQVKQVVLFHYDPGHDDSVLAQIEASIQAQFPDVQLAREGMVLIIGS
ncbi:MBL fold metallo-hydrolase [Leptolyngbya sp. GB1-A1]|uniref:MBL fold metallo-hydrolase n=1 Tax=Leptolyngbya sp. GB1-A1 TaxID=2933908 RepID=UPI003296AFC4